MFLPIPGIPLKSTYNLTTHCINKDWNRFSSTKSYELLSQMTWIGVNTFQKFHLQSFSKLIESRVIASIDEYTPTPLPVTKIDIWFYLYSSGVNVNLNTCVLFMNGADNFVSLNISMLNIYHFTSNKIVFVRLSFGDLL